MLDAIYVLFVLRTYYRLNMLYQIFLNAMCMLDAISIIVNGEWYVPSKCTDIGHRFRFIDVRIHHFIEE